MKICTLRFSSKVHQYLLFKVKKSLYTAKSNEIHIFNIKVHTNPAKEPFLTPALNHGIRNINQLFQQFKIVPWLFLVQYCCVSLWEWVTFSYDPIPSRDFRSSCSSSWKVSMVQSGRYVTRHPLISICSNIGNMFILSRHGGPNNLASDVCALEWVAKLSLSDFCMLVL